jgi:predicted  nucleic acid-binding Zn-ribbon protein
MPENAQPTRLTAAEDLNSEYQEAVQRLQQLRLMVARGREELRELEDELHRQQGRIEVLARSI